MGQKSRTKKAGQKVEQKMTDEQLGQKKIYKNWDKRG